MKYTEYRNRTKLQEFSDELRKHKNGLPDEIVRFTNRERRFPLWLSFWRGFWTATGTVLLFTFKIIVVFILAMTGTDPTKYNTLLANGQFDILNYIVPLTIIVIVNGVVLYLFYRKVKQIEETKNIEISLIKEEFEKLRR